MDEESVAEEVIGDEAMDDKRGEIAVERGRSSYSSIKLSVWGSEWRGDDGLLSYEGLFSLSLEILWLLLLLLLEEGDEGLVTFRFTSPDVKMLILFLLIRKIGV